MSNYIKVLPAVSTPIGATLMKTGQTTSYRTGDDGDIEAGRATDFFTLPSNNPFGNTNRFTSIVGTQTYTNNIIIDWSTYNGSNVLGYYKLASPLSHTWNQAIDWAVALSLGSYTSGWRLPNITEIYNLVYWNISFELNYSPFNIGAFSQYSSTTVFWDTTQSRIFIANSSNPMLTTAKSGSRNTFLACRTFTVTGTTLT
jgi:hypothetical protein